MATPTIYTKYKRPKKVLPERDMSTNVEQCCIPLKVKVQEMLLAGQQLKQYRKEFYDFTGDLTPEEQSPYISALRRRGLDIVDVTKEIERLNKRKLERDKQALEDAHKRAELQKRVSEPKEPAPKPSPAPTEPTSSKE